MHQLPTVFEFNEDLLLFILEHLQSGWFGDFMFNSEREKREHKADYGSLSMWAVVLHDSQRFINPSYKPQPGAILPVAKTGRMVVWSKWFHGWHDRLWRSAWIQDSTLDDTDDQPVVAKTWVDDKSVVGCRRCSRLFSITRRRHHCRRCGHIFCEKCAGDSRIVPTVSAWKPCRVCVECAVLIDEGVADVLGEAAAAGATEVKPIVSHTDSILPSSSSSNNNINRTKSQISSTDTLHHSRSDPILASRSKSNGELSVGERATTYGLVDDWNGEY